MANNFWADGFWADGFWVDGFWAGDGASVGGVLSGVVTVTPMLFSDVEADTGILTGEPSVDAALGSVTDASVVSAMDSPVETVPE